MKKWFLEDPELYNSFISLINDKYPLLNVTVEKYTVYIKGTLIIDISGTEIDRFLIEIELPDDYPVNIPKVKEIGERIPQDPDHHVNPDGTACLFLPEERFKYYPEGSTIVNFIERPIKSFFLWQIDHAHIGPSIFSQRKHGVEGIVEFYHEILDTDDIKAIQYFIELLTRNEIKGHWLCWCLSGKAMRKCCDHYNKVLIYKNLISHETANNSLKKIREKIQKVDISNLETLINRLV